MEEGKILGISSYIQVTDISSYKDFLEKEYTILIVDIMTRNCKKSNKMSEKVLYIIESTELYFSFRNFDEYKDIIGLINLLIDKLES